jgi:hypothetical protein
VRTSELDRLLAVARLGADLEAGPPEQLDQVEADDRLVFGYEDADSASLGGFGGMVLVAGVRWAFAGEDAGSAHICGCGRDRGRCQRASSAALRHSHNFATASYARGMLLSASIQGFPSGS